MSSQKSSKSSPRRLAWQSTLGRLFSDEHAVMVVLGVIVGVAGGYGAVGFRHFINFIQSISYGSPEELLNIIKSTQWYWRIIIPALGGLIVGSTVYFLAREARGHGVPEVMHAVALKQSIIRKRIVSIKTLVSGICIGTGGSVGREDPIVQIGSAEGSALGQLFNYSDIWNFSLY